MTGPRTSAISYNNFVSGDPYGRRYPPDLTTGSLWCNIRQLSWPMLIIMIFNFLAGFVDVYVTGFISPEVQAAASIIAVLREIDRVLNVVF